MSLTGLRELDIIATLGPKSVADKMVLRLLSLGATIFRINGSHEPLENIRIYASRIQDLACGRARVLVDLPGNKIRTKNLEFPLAFKKGDEIDLEAHQVNFKGFFDVLKEGEEILANDGLLKFEILKITKNKLTLKCDSSGELGNNKGLHAKTVSPLPFLLERDREILELTKKIPIDYIGLSFVRSAKDIQEVKELTGYSMDRFFVKVETSEAVERLDEILAASETILIDRGDLAADIGVIQIPSVQDRVIREAKARKVRVALATQFLHSMVEREVPLVAEVEALYHAMRMGVDAVQVSEETSIGYYPERVIETITSVFQTLPSLSKV